MTRRARLLQACSGARDVDHQVSLTMRLLAHPERPHKSYRPGARPRVYQRGDLGASA